MVRQHPMSYNCRLLKIRPHGRESISVTIYYIWLKYYLNFCLSLDEILRKFRLVADRMRSFTLLANAINNFKAINFNKKYNKSKNDYSLFSLTYSSRRSLTIFLTVMPFLLAMMFTSVLSSLGTSTTNLTLLSVIFWPPFLILVILCVIFVNNLI